jgi:glutaredoxin 2
MDPLNTTKAVSEIAASATQVNSDTSLIAWLSSITLISVIVFVGIVLRFLFKMNADTAARTAARNEQIQRSEVNQATIAANLAKCSETLKRVDKSLDDLFDTRLSQQHSIATHAEMLRAHDEKLKDYGRRLQAMESS